MRERVHLYSSQAQSIPAGESQQQGLEAVGRIPSKDGSDGCMPLSHLHFSIYTV